MLAIKASHLDGAKCVFDSFPASITGRVDVDVESSGFSFLRRRRPCRLLLLSSRNGETIAKGEKEDKVEQTVEGHLKIT